MADTRIIGMLAALTPLLLAGCASKGYVRDQVAAMQGDIAGVEQRLSRRADESDRGLAGLEATSRRMEAEIGSTRGIALGDVDLDEVTRCRVHFAFDSDEIRPADTTRLDEVAGRLQSDPRLLVDVYGFTDAIGPTRYNADLGRRRAEAVVRYLVDRTADPLPRYQILSIGERDAPSHELADLGTGEARRQALVIVLEPREAAGAAGLSQR